MKIKLERHTRFLNETIEKLQISHYQDWLKGYLYTATLIGFVSLCIVMLFLLFSGKLSPIVISDKDLRAIFFLVIVYALTSIILSAIWALTSVAFFRYMPKTSLIYTAIYNGFLSFSATISTANLLYKYKNLTCSTPCLIGMFIGFYVLIMVITWRVIRIVTKNVETRLKKTDQHRI
jgi:uncharacterized membrane protein